MNILPHKIWKLRGILNKTRKPSKKKIGHGKYSKTYTNSHFLNSLSDLYQVHKHHGSIMKLLTWKILFFEVIAHYAIVHVLVKYTIDGVFF